MEHDDLLYRFGAEPFNPAREVLGLQREGGNWGSALMSVGQWRQRDANLLRGIESVGVEGDIIQIPADRSQGFKLGIPESAGEGDIERALHIIVTIAAMATRRVCDGKTADGARNALDVEAREQVADIYRYINSIFNEDKEAGVHNESLRRLYDQYGEQVIKLIFATRNAVVANRNLLNAPH